MTRLSLAIIPLILFTAVPTKRAFLNAEDSHPRISGIYPHLTTYGVYSENGGHHKSGHNECGIGAVVPWANKLWMVNYAPHMPRGSEHKLFSIDSRLKMTIHPESVGGTPAGRMIHRESNQLLIGHYLLDAQGKVRVISPKVMPIRVTAITRHLRDPEHMVYYVDMEGSIYEANVQTLEVTRIFEKPVPGWHGKGAYVGQGRLVVSNNGEHAAGSYDPLLVGGAAKNVEEAGVLAEWDGKTWRIIERRQFTDVTGPDGIYGGKNDDAPVWAIGWDRRSLRLKLLEGGVWYTYLLPKAAHCNDARHGWYTEWPRIREITNGRWMMDMHGMFFNFPKTFSVESSAGLSPIGSHLRYVPDFCGWNDRLVLATDETSIQGNPLAGQPQSNLWFGSFDDLKTWGPASGYGGPWVEDTVKAGVPSDPFLVSGFDRRVLHLAVGANHHSQNTYGLRATDQQQITRLPAILANLPRVTVRRGDWHQPGTGFTFAVDQPVTVYLAVDRRGAPAIDAAWSKTSMTVSWGKQYQDHVYQRSFPAGVIEIPANDTEHSPGAFGMPHTAFVDSKNGNVCIQATKPAVTTESNLGDIEEANGSGSVTFEIEIDVEGNGDWLPYTKINVRDHQYVYRVLPESFDATWIRLTSDRDCIATAYLHQTAAGDAAGYGHFDKHLFGGLANVADDSCLPAFVYPAKRNRNLRAITSDSRYFEFNKESFKWNIDQPDRELSTLLKVNPEFTVDNASVVLQHRDGRLRLPKGPAAFDKPFASGWPRSTREVESERHLANILGTFYEAPLVTNGQPPAFELMRPIASHAKQIVDYCSWNGLLVLAGARTDAANDGHIFADQDKQIALWFGGVDDLWKFGKPIGHGGPWKDSPVAADDPSDPYLMTGYDDKLLMLSADQDVNVRIEVDVDHLSGWHVYRVISLKAGQTIKHQFPEGYSAHWVRFTADRDCVATAWLTYE